jgi:hypothetical protein
MIRMLLSVQAVPCARQFGDMAKSQGETMTAGS